MKLIYKSLFSIIGLVASFGAPAAADPLQDAARAHVRQDYGTALRLFQPLADQGNATAQTTLGEMYANGEGVPQDVAFAGHFHFKPRAEQNKCLRSSPF